MQGAPGSPDAGFEKWRRAWWLTPLVTVGSAGLLILAFPDFDLEPMAWLALAPFLARLPDLSPGKALAWAFAWAFLFYLVTISWLFPVAGFAAGMLAALCAAETAVGLWTARCFLGWKRGLGWVLAPFVWTAMEFLIASIPIFSFPWCLLGNSQYLNLPFIQICSITGVFGLSFLIVAVNAGIAFWLRWCLWGERNGGGRAGAATVLLAMGLIGIWLWGSARLRVEPAGKTARIALLQGNYDHLQKWSGEERTLADILRTYSRLSARAGRENPDLVVWPETAVPVSVLEVPVTGAEVEASVKASGAYSLVGSLKTPEDPNLEGQHNTAFLFGPDGEKRAAEYYKRHLVPFGEYVPFKKILFFVDIVSAGASIFAPGNQATLFEIPRPDSQSLKFGVLICYESAFPPMAREYARQDADLLVVITNDAWYGKTAMPWQHVALAVIRAVENGVPMVRSANTGVTCWSDARGRIGGVLRDEQGKSLFVEGLLIAEPRLEKLDTLYSRWGDVFSILCLVVTLVAAGAIVRPRIASWLRSKAPEGELP